MYEKSVKIPDAWKKDEEVFELLAEASRANKAEYQLNSLEYYGLDSITFCGEYLGNSEKDSVKFYCLKFNDRKIFDSNKKDFRAEGKRAPLLQLILSLYKTIKSQTVLFFDYEKDGVFKICIPSLKVGVRGENIYSSIYITNWIYEDFKSEKAALTLQEMNDVFEAAAQGNTEATFERIITAIKFISMIRIFDGIELKSTQNRFDTIESIFNDQKEIQERITANCKTVICQDDWRHNHLHVEPETLWHFLMSDKSLAEYCKSRGFNFLGDMVDHLKQPVYGEPEKVIFF